MEQTNSIKNDCISPLTDEIETYCIAKKVAPNSRYCRLYQLQNTVHFKLLDMKTNSVISVNISNKRESIFYGLEYYSLESKSFVIYTKNKNEYLLIFENGKKWICKYIGEEYNRCRPIQLLKDGKWIFFDTEKQAYLWNINNAIKFQSGNGLDRKLKHDYYTIFHCESSFDSSNKTYSLHCYRNHISSSYKVRFQSCYEEADYIIGQKGSSYYIFAAKYMPCHPVFISDKKPHLEGIYYIVHNEMGYSIIKKGIPLSSIDWETDAFLYIDDHCVIYNNGISIILYDIVASKGTSIIPIALLPLNWKIISFTGDMAQISTEEGMKYMKPQQILEQGKLYWEKYNSSAKPKTNLESFKVNEISRIISDEQKEVAMHQSVNNLSIRWAGLELKFPQQIKAFIIVERITPLYNGNKRGVELNYKISNIELSDFFIIFSIEDELMAIIRYEGYKDYRMYYYETLPNNILTKISTLKKNQFVPISQDITYTEKNYITILEKQTINNPFETGKHDEETVIIKNKKNMSKKSLVSAYLKALGFKDDNIKKAIAILFETDNFPSNLTTKDENEIKQKE